MGVEAAGKNTVSHSWGEMESFMLCFIIAETEENVECSTVKLSCNTPGIGPGFCDRALAVKKQKKTPKSQFS